jgi:hypothetical protein
VCIYLCQDNLLYWCLFEYKKLFHWLEFIGTKIMLYGIFADNIFFFFFQIVW